MAVRFLHFSLSPNEEIKARALFCSLSLSLSSSLLSAFSLFAASGSLSAVSLS